MLDLMESNLEPEIGNEPTGEIRCLYLTAPKVGEMPGWKARFSPRAGVFRTIDCYRHMLAPGT